jgi:uncharacterized membrane protein
MTSRLRPARSTKPRTVVRILLGAAITWAGISHLTVARQEFRAQVPEFVPLDPDVTVLASGIAEISLGAALVLLVRRQATVGWVAAVFFAAVFPGNIAQWVHHRDGFGLDTDTKRFVRLLFQPALMAVVLWATNALRNGRRKR